MESKDSKQEAKRQNVYYASGLVSLQVGGPIRMSVVYWKKKQMLSCKRAANARQRTHNNCVCKPANAVCRVANACHIIKVCICLTWYINSIQYIYKKDWKFRYYLTKTEIDVRNSLWWDCKLKRRPCLTLAVNWSYMNKILWNSGHLFKIWASNELQT